MTAIYKTLCWLKARDFAEIALGCMFGSLATAAFFALIQRDVNDVMNARAIENAQLQVADALTEANRFRASIECVMETIVDGCKRYEPRVRP